MDWAFNPLRTEVYLCHQNQKMPQNMGNSDDSIETTQHWYSFERYWDKLSGGTIIFEILPHLDEFISLFEILSKYLQSLKCKVTRRPWWFGLRNIDYSQDGKWLSWGCTLCKNLLFSLVSVCEYYAHIDCQDFVVSDCKECTTYSPNKTVSIVSTHSKWYGVSQKLLYCVLCSVRWSLFVNSYINIRFNSTVLFRSCLTSTSR
jgi:hypothetical protein